MAGAPFSIEGLLFYISGTFTAGVIQSYQGQGVLEGAPLLQQQDILEDFKKFGGENDLVFQEYDPPEGDNSKMAWKESRPTTWWKSLWKAMKNAFFIQIVGGIALGSIAILRTVPTIVIAHTFCASPDTRISYRRCLLIQGYFCAV